jgi:hypothetical protein
MLILIRWHCIIARNSVRITGKIIIIGNQQQKEQKTMRMAKDNK